MDLTVDLHSHSGASGGVGDVSLATVAETMAKKGIGVFGTGDALHDGWLAHLESALAPAEPGLYRLEGIASGARFLIQTEIIVTCPVEGGGRKTVHVVILLPGLAAARDAAARCEAWGVKRNIGRPFLACGGPDEVAERLEAIAGIDDAVEIIPAHVLTPQGIYGSNRPVDSMEAIFGPFTPRIRAVETGLSADPQVLALIPELDARTLLSASDCHSGALNRVGREFTTLRVDALSYPAIIGAIRNREVSLTAEFTPAEGRYFLTGHRAGRRGHEGGRFCYYSPDRTPPDGMCPICGKPLTVGVLDRALTLSRNQGESRTLAEAEPSQRFLHLVPLVEVLAAGIGVKSAASKKVRALYDRLLEEVGTETAFWALEDAEAMRVMERIGHPGAAAAVTQVRAGAFTFEPLGYDGEYGALVLGRSGAWFGHAVSGPAGAG
jgi:PHP family Zn ribbon phosphoesterase